MSINIRDEAADPNENDEDLDGSPEQLSPIEITQREHRLQYSYWLWFTKSRTKTCTLQGYEQSLKLVGEFSTVEQWWALYSHLVRPSDLPPESSLKIFKAGVRPVWEDEANINGGKWVIRLRKGQTSRAWEDLCMAMLGEQFMVGPELCGVVVNIKFQEDVLSVWHKTASDVVSSARIRDTLRRILHLTPGTLLEYKKHPKPLAAPSEPPEPEPAPTENHISNSKDENSKEEENDSKEDEDSKEDDSKDEEDSKGENSES